jgi:hypothetical protein
LTDRSFEASLKFGPQLQRSRWHWQTNLEQNKFVIKKAATKTRKTNGWKIMKCGFMELNDIDRRNRN